MTEVRKELGALGRERRRGISWQTWAVGLLIVAALAVRVGVAARQALWADEIFSLAMATGHSLEHPAAQADPTRGDYVQWPEARPASAYRMYLEHQNPTEGPGAVVRAVGLSDTSPPGYYLLLYGWTRIFGTSDAALRLMSILLAAACFPLLWSVGRQLGGRWTGLAAVTLFAVAPLSVYYSTEGRMYSLLWFWVLALVWLTLRVGSGRAVRNGADPHPNPLAGSRLIRSLLPAYRERGKEAGASCHLVTLSPCHLVILTLWTLVSAAGFYTHYFFAFPWGACAVWLLVQSGWRRRGALLAAMVLVGLLILPWYIHVPQTLKAWRITQGWLERRPDDYHPVTALVGLAWSYFSSLGDWNDWTDWQNLGQKARWPAIIAFCLVALVLLIHLPRRWFRRRLRLLAHPKPLLLWLCLAAALGGPVLFDLLLHTYTKAVPRYVIAGLPAALLLIALALRVLRPRVRLAMLGLIVVAWMPADLRIFRNRARIQEEFDTIGRALAASSGPNDVIVVHSIPSGVIGVARYMTGVKGANGGAELAGWTEQLKRRMAPEDLERLAAGKQRIFFVRAHDVWADAPEEKWLREHAKVAGGFNPGYAEVTEFVPREGSVFFPDIARP